MRASRQASTHSFVPSIMRGKYATCKKTSEESGYLLELCGVRRPSSDCGPRRFLAASCVGVSLGFFSRRSGLPMNCLRNRLTASALVLMPNVSAKRCTIYDGPSLSSTACLNSSIASSCSRPTVGRHEERRLGTGPPYSAQHSASQA